MKNVPANAARVVFDTIPAGSYASPGDVYLVKHYANRAGKVHTVELTNVATGGRTSDAPIMYRHAAWRVAA